MIKRETASLHAAVFGALMARDPQRKIAAVRQCVGDHASGRLAANAVDDAPAVSIPTPGRPALPKLVSPRELAQRGLGTPHGRAALLHAVAHIEFNAINLALDAVYRFRDMPETFYSDWLGVAADEARHFELLAARLADYELAYGTLPAHDGLWEMAVKTMHDPIARMALVPRVLEARGLDVTPGMIERLRHAGDDASADILDVILTEEVAHVAAGSRWFEWLCGRAGLDARRHFLTLIRTHAPGAVRPPFNLEARRRAGFDAAELAALASSVA